MFEAFLGQDIPNDPPPEDDSENPPEDDSENPPEDDEETPPEDDGNPSDQTPGEPDNTDPELILSYYTDNIEDALVQEACVKCHSLDKTAQDTDLVFVKGADNAESNQDTFSRYFYDNANALDLILSKVRGGSAHGGELQFSCEQTEFQNLEHYLQLLAGDGAPNDVICDDSFWDDIVMSDASITLRRAAIIMAGRLPTNEELVLAQSGSAGLRSSIRALMTGSNFHEFLLRGANDQLLMKGLVGTDFQITSRTHGAYPILTNKNYDANVAAAAGDDTLQREFTGWFSAFKYGVANAPLKLIAHVVENDLPYTDILTANYTMVNPYSNEVFRSGIEFEDDTNALDFKPGLHQGQIFDDDEYVTTGNLKDLGRQVSEHSGFIEYPHAGLLNDPAYLNRYPSTDTNRNRARASWTYKHFLNVDIEKSAARTTDPDDLADTNNPTLNNPACTVCHVVMDPVAGAFQNYGDSGRYRMSSGGLDSLPSNYKRGSDSLYQEFDTWYRDMLEPGFNDSAIIEQDNSLQILGQRIISDERFPKASVAFWWTALMSGALPQAPEEISDPNYLANLSTYEEVQNDINELASGFTLGFNGGSAFNLKDLLVEMVMTPWFQAIGSSEDLPTNADVTLAKVGTDRLLTPEELALKTKDIMGFSWGEATLTTEDDPRYDHLSDKFHIYYGGIDSIGITERARELTALMSNVALGQALAVSCPAVVMDINKPENERILFGEMSRHITPLTQGHGQFEITAQDAPQAYSVEITITTIGEKRLRFSFDNQDGNGQQSRKVYLDRFLVSATGGSEILSMEAEDILDDEGVALDYDGSTSGSASNGYWSLTSGYIEVPISFTQTGNYTVTLHAYGITQEDGVAPQISAHINDLDPLLSNTGSIQIKSQLQALHKRLLGENLDIDSEELAHTYQYFVDVWQGRWSDAVDFYIFDSSTEMCEEPEGTASFSNDELADPQHTLAAWSQVLLYLMTDYKYLHE